MTAKKLQKIIEELQGTCPKILVHSQNRRLLHHEKQVVYAELQVVVKDCGSTALELGPRKDCVLILCNDLLVVAEPDLFGKSLTHIHTFDIEQLSMNEAPPEASAGGKLGDENEKADSPAYLIVDSLHSFTCWFDNKDGVTKMTEAISKLQDIE